MEAAVEFWGSSEFYTIATHEKPSHVLLLRATNKLPECALLLSTATWSWFYPIETCSASLSFFFTQKLSADHEQRVLLCWYSFLCTSRAFQRQSSNFAVLGRGFGIWHHHTSACEHALFACCSAWPRSSLALIPARTLGGPARLHNPPSQGSRIILQIVAIFSPCFNVT